VGVITPQLASLRTRPGAILDSRIAKFESQGLNRAKILEQLLAARWPIDQIRERFTEFPNSAFAYPQTEITPAPASMPGPNASKVLPSASTPVIDRATVNAVSAAEGISFQYVPLIQCSFPHADPKLATSFTRKNGWLELTLGTTHPEYGLPYGVPARLLTIYCTSEAVRTHSPEIYLGDSVHDFLRRLDVPVTRGARGSLSVYANQLLRLIASTLSIDENIRDGAGRQGLHMRQALFVEEARLWWDKPQSAKNRKGAGRAIGNGSSLMLSSVLFHSILERSAPLATSAIKQLRKSPMDLDVYAWLVHRLFHLGKPSMVSWEQLSNQFGHNYREPRTFRRFFLDSLKRVSAVYPEAKVNVGASGVLLLPSRPHLARSTVPSKR
jgi:Plasmid encoded RepA protein